MTNKTFLVLYLLDEDKEKETFMSSHIEQATFGGGCFWCTEAIFQSIAGVSKVTSGYCGGHDNDPKYEAVCNGVTGHAEAIQIEFDISIINYASILKVFWDTHDPTTLNQQGADIGTQYRSVIFFHDPTQEKEATKLKQEIEKSNRYENPIVTEIVKFNTFFPAESYHQNYYSTHPDQPYCKMVIKPKITKFRSKYSKLIYADKA